jgi:hypothetical protein
MNVQVFLRRACGSLRREDASAAFLRGCRVGRFSIVYPFESNPAHLNSIYSGLSISLASRGRAREILANFRNLIGGNAMPLINVVITLMVVGVLMWLVNRYVPMQGTIKGILNAVVVIVVVLWIVNIFGLYHYVSQFRVGP